MYQDLSSPPVPNDFNGKSKIRVQLWYLTWLFLFRPSPLALNGFRLFLLRVFGAKVGNAVKIRPSAFISYPWNLSVGEGTFIGDHVHIDSLTRVSVGAHVSLSNYVYIASGTHDYKVPSFDLVLRPVTIEDQCWLAVQTTVLPGVTMSKGCVVGARSLVTRSVPENEVWAGTPARFMSKRS